MVSSCLDHDDDDGERKINQRRTRDVLCLILLFFFFLFRFTFSIGNTIKEERKKKRDLVDLVPQCDLRARSRVCVSVCLSMNIRRAYIFINILIYRHLYPDITYDDAARSGKSVFFF